MGQVLAGFGGCSRASPLKKLFPAENVSLFNSEYLHQYWKLVDADNYCLHHEGILVQTAFSKHQFEWTLPYETKHRLRDPIFRRDNRCCARVFTLRRKRLKTCVVIKQK